LDEIVWLDEALQDVEAIGDYIASTIRQRPKMWFGASWKPYRFLLGIPQSDH
jgi:hypothetical protein